MRELNTDIQANHGVLLALENAKQHWEKFIQDFNGIFAITNEKFDILFCNEKLTQILDLTTLNYYRKNFLPIFSDQDQKVLRGQLKELLKEKSNAFRTFEITVKEHSQLRSYVIMASIFPVETSEGALYSIFGHDISELKNSERRLEGVFSAIPLGVITLGAGGLIEDGYSAASLNIIGQESIIGKTLLDTLMSEVKDELFLAEIKALANLSKVIGNSVNEYELLTKSLPQELHTIRENSEGRIVEKWISVNYKPIISNNCVERLIVVFDDISRWAILERERTKLSLLEDNVVRRLFHVRSVSPEYALSMKNEIGTLVQSVNQSIKTSDRSQLLRSLHALKGNFRAVDFKDLSKLVHDVEGNVIHNGTNTETEWSRIREEFLVIEKEWSAIDRTIDFSRGELSLESGDNHSEKINSSHGDLLEINSSLDKIADHIQYAARVFDTELLIINVKKQNMVGLNSFETPIREQFSRLITLTGKKADLTFEWDNIVVTRSVSSLLRQALLHLINNAMDHGIEHEAERVARGKRPAGLIKITATIDPNNRLQLMIFDDGRGISESKVKEKAIKRGLITPHQAAEMSSDDAVALVFKPGFSTNDEVTEISGRGIGLDAIVSSLNVLDGKVMVKSRLNQGSLFFIDIFAGYQFGVRRRCLTTGKFVGLIDEMVYFLKDKGIREIKFVPQLGQSQEGRETIVYLDAEKIAVAIMLKCIFSFENQGALSFKRMGKDLKIDFFGVARQSNSDDQIPLECDSFLRDLYFNDVTHQHQGETQYDSDGKFSSLLIKNVFFENFDITVAFSRSVSQRNVEIFTGRLQKVVGTLSGKIVQIPQPTPKLDLWISDEPNEFMESKITTVRTMSSDSVIESMILNILSLKGIGR